LHKFDEHALWSDRKKEARVVNLAKSNGGDVDGGKSSTDIEVKQFSIA
jgi:hypothetical protein